MYIRVILVSIILQAGGPLTLGKVQDIEELGMKVVLGGAVASASEGGPL